MKRRSASRKITKRRSATKPLYHESLKQSRSFALTTWVDVFCHFRKTIVAFLITCELGEIHHRLSFLSHIIRRKNHSFYFSAIRQHEWLAKIHWYAATWYNSDLVTFLFPISANCVKIFRQNNENEIYYITIFLRFEDYVYDDIISSQCKWTFGWYNAIEMIETTVENGDLNRITEFDPRAILTDYVRYCFSSTLWNMLRTALVDLCDQQNYEEDEADRYEQFLLEQQQLFFKTIGAYTPDVYCRAVKLNKGDKVPPLPPENLWFMTTVFFLPDVYKEEEKKYNEQQFFAGIYNEHQFFLSTWNQMLHTSVPDAIRILHSLKRKNSNAWTPLESCQYNIFLIRLRMCLKKKAMGIFFGGKKFFLFFFQVRKRQKKNKKFCFFFVEGVIT